MTNNKTKTIRISSDTLNKLGNERIGFETPEECINRLLTKNPCEKKEDEVVAIDESEKEKT